MSNLALVFDEDVSRVSFGNQIYVAIAHTLGAPLDVGDYLLLVTYPGLPIRAYETQVLSIQHVIDFDNPLDSEWKYCTQPAPIPSGLLYPHLSHKQARVREAIEQILEERDPLALLVYRSEPHESRI